MERDGGGGKYVVEVEVCVGVHECLCVLSVDVQACLIGSKPWLLCCDVHGVFLKVNEVHSPSGLSNIPCPKRLW